MSTFLENHCFHIHCINFKPQAVQYNSRSFKIDCSASGDLATTIVSSAYRSAVMDSDRTASGLYFLLRVFQNI